MHGQRVGRPSVFWCVMKPLVSDGALKALFITVGGVLCAVAVALADLPEVIHPRWVVLLASVGGILGGKEALMRRGDIPVQQLPLEWQRKTDPPQ
jgi:hypothetical protein